MDIQIVRKRISKKETVALAQAGFGEMVKGVVDVARRLLALGGELHADAEAVLLEDGSQQKDVWGFNLYPEKQNNEWVEFSSFINIRPSQGNRSMEIKDPVLQEQIRKMIDDLIE